MLRTLFAVGLEAEFGFMHRVFVFILTALPREENEYS